MLEVGYFANKNRNKTIDKKLQKYEDIPEYQGLRHSDKNIIDYNNN